MVNNRRQGMGFGFKAPRIHLPRFATSTAQIRLPKFGRPAHLTREAEARSYTTPVEVGQINVKDATVATPKIPPPTYTAVTQETDIEATQKVVTEANQEADTEATQEVVTEATQEQEVVTETTQEADTEATQEVVTEATQETDSEVTNKATKPKKRKVKRVCVIQ